MKQVLSIIAIAILTGCASSTPNNPAAEQAIEQAIRDEISKPEGELTAADLVKIKNLGFRLKEKEISDLDLLTDLTQIEELRLSFNKINDVRPLKDLKQLRVLNLSDNQITDVSALKGLKQLRRLNLSYNPDLTKDKIGELQKALPNCDIIHNAAK